MEKTNDSTTQAAKLKGKAPLYKKLLKIGAWIVGCVALLIIIAMCVIAWVLTPKQLTPMVTDIANESINADVKMSKIELTAWSTFPDVTVDIDSLCVVSKSFANLPAEARDSLPAYADTLLTAKHVHAGLNILKLLYGSFSLKNIYADDMKVNLVAVDENTANYLVSLPSDEPESTEPLQLPSTYWDKFNLNGDTRITYYSAIDTMEANVRLTKASINNADGDIYDVSIEGTTDFSMGGMEYITALPLTFNGKMEWNSDHLANVGLSDMNVTAHDIPALMNMHVTTENTSTLDLFDINLGPVKLSSVVEILPPVYSELFNTVKSDINATLTAKLTEPYDLMGTDLPSLDATLIIPDSYIATVNGMARLDRVAMDADISIKGKQPDQSSINLKKMILDGKAVNLEVNGTVSNFLDDAHVKGNLKGGADIGNIVQVFNLPVSFTVKGELEANAYVDMKMSDLSANRFHEMTVNGDMSLHDLYYNSIADTISLYAKNANLKFGNNDETVFNGNKITNLLHFNTSVDSLSAYIAGMSMTMKNARLGVGCVDNDKDKSDTTRVIPIGGRITADRMSLEQADSTKIRLRGLDCGGSISRFEGDAHLPKITLSVGSKGLAYLSRDIGVVLRNSRMNISANIRKRPQRRENPFHQRVDSIRKLHPGWSNDSVLFVASNGRIRPNRPKMDNREIIDMSVDKSFQKMLLDWQMHGSVRSSRGRIFTPYFPLRNTLSDINMDFSTDSVVFNNVAFSLGQSQFNVKGGIRNIRGSLLGRQRRPLDIKFTIKADTLNANQLIKAATDGMAFVGSGDNNNAYLTAANEETLENLTANAATETDTTLAAFIVPSNIDAAIRLRASNVLYTDIILNKFDGDLLMHDGVINLRNLTAKTDIGSAEFNAMYAAPDRQDIKVGFDLGMQSIQIGKFLKMIPGVDSIMPLLESIDGVIDADIAATTNIDSAMNVITPSLKMAMKLHGEDLVFMDAETFKKVAKMLLFKNKERNVIDEMTVEMLIEDSQLELFPFMFDVDRYRLGVLGHNDLDLNFRYHISVLKSPIPFKFGINIYGNPDDMHFRFGGAKYKNDMSSERVKIVDTTRINLREQINSAFSRGAKAALKSDLKFTNRPRIDDDLKIDTTANFSHEDSLQMIQGGFIEAPQLPDSTGVTTNPAEATEKKDTSENNKQNKNNSDKVNAYIYALIPKETAYSKWIL